MQGGDQHRSLLTDLLWKRAEDIINERSEISEEQKTLLNRYFHDLSIKTPEDVLVRAKSILQRGSGSSLQHALDLKEELFMLAVFSFHPNHESRNLKGQVRVGMCMGHHTFFIKAGDSAEVTEKDAISLKKCLVGLSQAYTIALREYSEKRYLATPLKKIS
jgi:hypothetical protein